MLLLLTTAALAGSVDAIEVGGPWGTVTATEPTALWWNPAGIAAGSGTQLYAEGAPTWGRVEIDRINPNGGPDTLVSGGLVPYGGITSDFTVPGLGVGMGLAIPVARPGKELEPPGSGSYHLRSGQVAALHGIFAAAYELKDRISIGAAVHLVSSSWDADLDFDALPDLVDQMEELDIDELEGVEIDYDDDDLESDDYRVNLSLEHLRDTQVTWSVGTRVQPIEQLAIGVTYVSPFRVDNTGNASLGFQCPSQDDTVGRYGMEAFGLCKDGAGRTLKGNGKVSYDLPTRIHIGIMGKPMEALRLELFGAWVQWSRFTDFDITVGGIEENNTFDTALQEDLTPTLAAQERQWARDNVDAYFIALDTKYTLGPLWLVGSRVTFDRSAVPDAAISPNNYDANTVILMGHAAVSPMPALRIGLSYSEYLAVPRQIATSAFGMTLGENRNPDRYYYPQMAGTYTSHVHRAALNLMLQI